MLLALDIGNTNISLGVFHGEELKTTWRSATDLAKMPEGYGLMFNQLLRPKKRERRSSSGRSYHP